MSADQNMRNAEPVRESGLPKWLPWLIGIAAVLLLFSWIRGCGKAPATGAMTDSTQTMMAPEPRVDTVHVAPTTVDTVHVRTADTVHVRTADTVMVPATAPVDTAQGAMGGQGKPGKKAPPKPTP